MHFDNKFREKSGIYQIKNKVNHKIYVGSSINMYLRFLDHRAELRHNTHSNPHLQNAFNKYGEDNFEFSVLQLCDTDILRDLEQWYIDILKPDYNICLDSTILPPRGNESRSRQSMTRKKMFLAGDLTPTKTHPVFIYYKDGSYIGYFPTITKAAKALGIRNVDRLGDTITGKYFQCKGYRAFSTYQEKVEPFDKPSNLGKTFKRKLYRLTNLETGETINASLETISNLLQVKKTNLQQYVNKNLKLKRKYSLCRTVE